MSERGHITSATDPSYKFGFYHGPVLYRQLVEGREDWTVGEISNLAIGLAIARTGRYDAINRSLALAGLSEALDIKTLRGDRQL